MAGWIPGMGPLIIFGIIGGCICAMLAYPYGLLASILAYTVGGALCALLPGILNHIKQEAFANVALHQEELGRAHGGATLQSGTSNPSIEPDVSVKP
jgi:hypothetical protein